MNCINIGNQISVGLDMQISVFLNNNELSFNDLKWILTVDMKLTRWSQLENLLSHYRNKGSESITNPQSYLTFLNKGIRERKKSLNFISSEHESEHYESNEDDNIYNILSLLVDQINLLVSKKKHYSSETIIMSFMLYTISPCAYDLMRGYINLPTKRYLQYLSSNMDVSPNTHPNNTIDCDKSTTNYLNIVSSSLKPNEKIVNLLIDKIYISKRLDYRGKNLIGVASNDSSLATTVLAFMIVSAFGNFSEIVKLLPVHNIKGNEMVPITKNVISLIQKKWLSSTRYHN